MICQFIENQDFVKISVPLGEATICIKDPSNSVPEVSFVFDDAKDLAWLISQLQAIRIPDQVIEAEEPDMVSVLLEAVRNYFKVWENEGKKPGWCDRMKSAKSQLHEAMAKAAK
jgi:hypothetical protein